MRIMIATSAVLGLCACTTTPAELREREVVGTFETTKPANDVAACLAEAFSKVGPPVLLDKNGSKIVEFHSSTIYYSGSTVLMFTITPDHQVQVQRANPLLASREQETGRASCRERVCQY